MAAVVSGRATVQRRRVAMEVVMVMIRGGGVAVAVGGVGRCERRSSLLSLRVVFRECWAGLSVLLGKLQGDATVGTAAR
jgi:hypothetical protein